MQDSIEVINIGFVNVKNIYIYKKIKYFKKLEKYENI